MCDASLILDLSGWKGVSFTASQLLVHFDKVMAPAASISGSAARKKLMYKSKTPRWVAFQDQWWEVLEGKQFLHTAINLLLDPPSPKPARAVPSSRSAAVHACDEQGAAEKALSVVAAAAARQGQQSQMDSLRETIAAQRDALATAHKWQKEVVQLKKEVSRAHADVSSLHAAADATTRKAEETFRFCTSDGLSSAFTCRLCMHLCECID